MTRYVPSCPQIQECDVVVPPDKPKWKDYEKAMVEGIAAAVNCNDKIRAANTSCKEK